MGIFSSKEEDDKEDYELGQKQGSEAGIVSRIVHDLPFGGFTHSEKWNEGFENGAKNQPKDK